MPESQLSVEEEPERTKTNRMNLDEALKEVHTLMMPRDPTKSTNPKDRLASNRLDLSLFPASARAYGALAFTEGAFKYGPYNWRTQGVRASVYYAACNRHFDKWFNREWADPATGVPHLASAIASLAIVVDAFVSGNLIDDRPEGQLLGPLLESWEDRVKRLREQFAYLVEGD